MVLLACCVFDVVVLGAGLALALRLPWRGAVREVAIWALFASAAAALGILATGAAGLFAALRGLCHALFCVVLPALAVRALRVRRDAPWLAAAALATFVVGEACYVWALEVEPFRLEIVQRDVTSARLAGLRSPLRVAVVADLQAERIGAWEVAVVDAIVAAEPDLVLFAGDYLQAGTGVFARELPRLQEQLRRLRPPLGSYAVVGDVDVLTASRVFADTPVRLVDDETVELPGVPVDVIGLSRARSRMPRADAGLARRLASGRFAIVLGHAPDYMRAVLEGGLQADALFVAGHTHGGQIQVPCFGPIVTLSSVPRWLAGGGVFLRGSTWLCVSRGIGMEREDAPRIRFWCRPQLVLLDLRAAP